MISIINSEREVGRVLPIILLLLFIMTAPMSIRAQEKQTVALERGTLIAAAREIINDVRYCALITIDKTGRPQVRTMDPFPPEKDMVIWLGTNKKSKKVQEIRNDPRVTLYYADARGGGYVTISGIARLVDAPTEKARRWKE